MNSQAARETLRAGKLPPELLARLLKRLDTAGDPSVIVGPRPGEDAAVIDTGDGYLVAKMDPITFATDRIGWYAVQVNANDIAATGGDPRWMMATLLLPEGSDPNLPEKVFGQLEAAASELGITLIGGHTEATVGLPRPIVSGAMLGLVKPGRQVTTGGARPGDEVILTSGIAVEGTAILAAECADLLGQAGLPPEHVGQGRDFLDRPGISIVRDAQIARAAGEVHAMHDPTEGGLATGLRELAEASGVGLAIDGDAVHIYPECARFCDALGLDPWGLIASGALIVAVEAGSGAAIVRELKRNNRRAAVIGEATAPGSGLVVSGSGGRRDLPIFQRDEIARLMGA